MNKLLFVVLASMVALASSNAVAEAKKVDKKKAEGNEINTNRPPSKSVGEKRKAKSGPSKSLKVDSATFRQRIDDSAR